MSVLEQITVDCESLIVLRAFARMVLVEIFSKYGFIAGYDVRRYNLFSFGLSSTTLWLFADPHWKAISQKLLRRYSVFTKNLTKLFIILINIFFEIRYSFVISFIFKT